MSLLDVVAVSVIVGFATGLLVAIEVFDHWLKNWGLGEE